MEKEVAPAKRSAGRQRNNTTVFLLTAVGLFVVYLTGAQIWHMALHRLISVDFLNTGHIDLVSAAGAILIKNEITVNAPARGEFKPIVKDGSRVSVGTLVGKIVTEDSAGEIALRAPAAGIFCIHTDGLENVLKPGSTDIIEISKAIKLKTGTDNSGDIRYIAEKGFPVFKIIDNLSPLTMYIQIARPFNRNDLEEGKVITFIWGNLELRSAVESIKVDKDSVQALLTVRNYPDAIVHYRNVEVKLVREKVFGYIIPASALVQKNGGRYIYIIKKQHASLCPVELKAAESGRCVISGKDLRTETRYILNPGWIGEGDRVE